MRDVHCLLERDIIDRRHILLQGISVEVWGEMKGEEGGRLPDRERIDIRRARCERSFRVAHLLAQRVPDARNIN